MPEQVLAFTSDVAARLTGLSERQLRRLDAEGIVRPTLMRQRQRYGRIYSFEDLVTLRMIRLLRRRGLSRRQLRLVAEALTERFPETATAESAGRLPGSVDLATVRGEMRRRVDRLKKRTSAQIGKVIIDRHIQGGEPVFAGTRIRVATIQSLLRAGHTDAEILGEYPRLLPADIALARQRLDKHSIALAS